MSLRNEIRNILYDQSLNNSEKSLKIKDLWHPHPDALNQEPEASDILGTDETKPIGGEDDNNQRPDRKFNDFPDNIPSDDGLTGDGPVGDGPDGKNPSNNSSSNDLQSTSQQQGKTPENSAVNSSNTAQQAAEQASNSNNPSAAKQAQQAAEQAKQASEAVLAASDPQQAQEAATQTQEASNVAQDAANRAQSTDANSAESAAKNAANAAQNAANAAQNAANAASSQDPQTRQDAADAARNAANAAQEAANKARQAAKNAAKEGDTQAADDANRAANQAQQAANAANQAANAAEQGNKQSAQQSANSAQQSANQARQSSNYTQSSSQSTDRSNSSSNPSSQAQSAADQAQSAADQANKNGNKQQADAAQDAADQAKKAAQDAKNASNQAQSQQAANEAQQAANKAQEAANDAQSNNMNDVQSAAKNAANAAQNAANAAQNAANAAKSGDQKAMKEAADAAQSAADAANDAAQQAQQAAEQAAKNGDMKAANQAQQAADAANDAAQAAQQAADVAKQGDSKSAQQAANQAQQAANDCKNNNQNNNQNGKGNTKQNSNQQGGGFSQEQQDDLDYYDGYKVGAYYANEVYKNKGLIPFTDFEIPENLEEIKLIKESLNEGDDNLEDIVSDPNMDVEEKIDAIEDLMNNKMKKIPLSDINKMEDNPLEVDPEGRKKKGKGGWFGTENVISKEMGDKIRERHKSIPRQVEKNFLMDDDPGVVLDQYGDILRSLRNRFKRHDVSVGPIDQLEGKLVTSRIGVGNWKEWLRDFLKRPNGTKFDKKGHVKTGNRSLSGVTTRHARVIKQGKMKDVVLYLDTTGSVFPYVSLLIAEIKKMADVCGFKGLYVNSFTTKVLEHGYASREDVNSDKFGIHNPNFGCTDLTCVYEHILSTYTDENGNPLPNIDSIIILTDTDGLCATYNGQSVATYSEVLSYKTFKEMFYLVFNNTFSNRIEADKYIPEYINENSTYKCAEVAALGELKYDQDNDEATNENVKIMKLSEKFNLFEGRRSSSVTIDQSSFSDEGIEKALEKEKVSAYNVQKITGKVDDEQQIKVKEVLEKNFPGIKYYPSANALMILDSGELGYHISVDGDYILLKANIDNKNIDKLMEVANMVNIKVLIGNLILTNNAAITSFPPGFPKKIEGDMTLMTLPKLINFNNAPKAVTGNVTIRVAPSPGSVMGRKLSKTITPEREQAYASSITKTVNPVDDDERHPKDLITRGNMINKSNESVADIIKNRIMLGESFMKEGRDTEFSDMFPYRTKPQWTEPNSDEYEKRKVHYDNKREQYEKEMSEWETMKDVADKNWMVFRNIINPILKINIGDIRNEGSLKDKIVAYPNIQDVRDKAVAASSKFKGAMIFTTNNNLISAMYCKMRTNKDPYMVCLRDDNGNVQTNHNFIESEFKKRWEVMHRLYLISEEIGIDWNNLAKGEHGVDDKYVSLEKAALGILYPVLCTLHGGSNTFVYRANKAATEYKYVQNVLDEDQFSSMTSKQVFDYIMNMIFPDFYPKGDNLFDNKNTSYKLSGTTINFKFNQVNRQNFIFYSLKNLKNNIFDIFNDKLLRILAVGASLRDYDGYPMVDPSTIEDKSGNVIMDHSDLTDLLYSIKDVNIFDTCLKSMSTKDIDKDEFDIDNPSDLLLYFPDLCVKGVNIKIDIDKAAEEAIYKLSKREVDKTNIYNTIKDYEYDPETRTRSRHDIIGSEDIEKVVSSNDDLDMFTRNLDAMLADIAVFNEAKKSLKFAIEHVNSTINQSWEKDNETEYRFENAFKSIYDISSMLKTKFINNVDLVDKYKDTVVNMNDKFIDIFSMLVGVINGNTYEDKIKSAKDFIDLSNEFKGYYRTIAGGDIKYAEKELNKSKRLSDRNSGRFANQGATSVRINPNIDKFSVYCDNMSGKYTRILNIVNDIDFNMLDSVSKTILKSKSDIDNVVETCLNNIISFGKSIVSDGNIDVIDNLVSEYNEVNNICDDIINTEEDYGQDADDKIVIYLIQILSKYIKIANVAKRYNINVQAAATV